jgi:hypothetical protein
VIILDTNQLRANRTLDTPMLGVLQAVANQTGHRLGLPSLVVDEVVASFRRDLVDKGKALDESVKVLKELDRDWGGAAYMLPDPEESARTLRAKLYARFEVLPGSPDIAVAALNREIERQLPAYEAGGSGCGARDVAIWLATLQALQHEDIYFVASDKRAYGESILFRELQQEADAIRDGGLKFCPTVFDLLGLLAEQQEISKARVLELAGNARARAVIGEALKGADALGQLIAYLPRELGLGTHTSWISSSEPKVQAKGASEMRAFGIDDRLWVCSRVQWQVQQTVTLEQATPNYFDIHADIPSTLLFEVSQEAALIDAQVLAFGRYELIRVVPMGGIHSAHDESLTDDSISEGPTRPISAHDESLTDDKVS